MAQSTHALALDAAQSRMIRAFGRRHPTRIAVSVLVIFTLFLTLPYFIWGSEDVTGGTGVVSFDGLTGGLIWQAILALVLIAIVVLLGWLDIVGFQGPIDRFGLRTLYWVGALPLLGVIGFSFGLIRFSTESDPVHVIAIVLILNFCVGLSEELLFRGILFGGLRQRHRLITAIIASSIAFGSLHLVNLGIDQAFALTAFQVVNATALGALFCAICLQANSLWPAILLHMIWNSYVMLGQAFAEMSDQADFETLEQAPVLGIESLVLPAILFLIAILVFRKYTRRTGQSLWTVSPTPTQQASISA